MDGGSSGRCGRSSRNVLPCYKLGRTLGIGAFGKVKLAVHTLTGLKVAIKILDRRSIDSSEAEKVRKEINIMKQLFHPHIVRLFEVIDTPTKVYVVMEYMNSGELFYFITEHGRLDENEARHFFQQLICRQLYAGPEVDVWSCGVILYALLCGRLPFDDDNLPGLYAKIKSGVYPVGNHLSEGAQHLISRILVVDPMKRISIPEIRKHPWFMIHLPPYIANPSPDYLHRTGKVDLDVVRDMVQLGFDAREVIGSLLDHRKNEATVTYTMLLHNRPLVQVADLIQDKESLSADNLQTCSESASHGQSNWTLGLKSQASPGATMLEVLNAFHRLNVKWKRIGSYNVKCLWSPPPSRCSVSASTGICIRSGDVVKFEIQVSFGSFNEFKMENLGSILLPSKDRSGL
ncbi:hypothetical protein F511_02485 [Dorcoceras hygrometricum]|nr:hypothetical protein F511_02485 [Dorcoceras hygrometricum]